MMVVQDCSDPGPSTHSVAANAELSTNRTYRLVLYQIYTLDLVAVVASALIRTCLLITVAFTASLSVRWADFKLSWLHQSKLVAAKETPAF